MIKKASIILAILLIITIVILLVLQNGDRVNFTFLFPSWQLAAINAGVLVIMAFSTGFLIASAIAAIYSLRGFWREFSLSKKDRRREEFYQILASARSASAIGNWEDALSSWQKVSKKDPENIIAKIEIARATKKLGKNEESLTLIDNLRRSTNDNPEVLIAAIQLNQELNNKTAAYDNAVLILKQQKSAKVLKIARDLAEDIGKIEEAISYHKELGSLEASADYITKLAELEFKKLLIETSKFSAKELRKSLINFSDRYNQSAEALIKLAEVEIELNMPEDASKHLAEAAKISNCPGIWKKAIQIWVTKEEPNKALSVARTATKNSAQKSRLYTELYLIKTLITFNMLDEALELSENFPQLVKNEKIEVPNELAQQFLIAKSLLLSRLGKIKESTDILTKISNLDFSISQGFNHQEDTSGAKQPAPELSTP